MEIDLEDLFTHPTARALGEHIASERRELLDTAVPLGASGSQPPIFLVHDSQGTLRYAHHLKVSLIGLRSPRSSRTHDLSLRHVELR